MLGVLQELEVVGRIPALPTILNVMTRTTGLRLAALARVTEERWIACAVEDGLGSTIVRGLDVEAKATLCYETFRTGRTVVIDDLTQDPTYRDHPRLRAHDARSVISVPVILPDGVFFGTLVGYDKERRRLNTPEIIGSLELLSTLIAFHLSAELELVQSQEQLASERQIAELREQFIAVLGHDLRNPLASVAAGARLIERRPEKAAEIALHMNDSIQRMSGLIDEVLDFARGRFGGGLGMELAPNTSIREAVNHVIHELRSARPDRVIEADLQLDQPVCCDLARIGQLVSNLLGNALTHGAAHLPVTVTGRQCDGHLELSVANGGVPIPAHAMERLFEPFVRGPESHDKQGLGLGLYIAAEIARGHGGSLDVASDDEATRFTFRMPLPESLIDRSPMPAAAAPRV